MSEEAYQKNEDYNLISPKTKEVVGKLSAKLVFDEIADGAWRTGDPGLIFIDKINKSTANPVPVLGEIEANPFLGKKLHGKREGQYSFRVWPYRIVYKVYKNELLILVIDFGDRRDVY